MTNIQLQKLHCSLKSISIVLTSVPENSSRYSNTSDITRASSKELLLQKSTKTLAQTFQIRPLCRAATQTNTKLVLRTVPVPHFPDYANDFAENNHV